MTDTAWIGLLAWSGSSSSVGAEQVSRPLRLTFPVLPGYRVVELDKQFWSKDLDPLSPDEWARVQEQLAAGQQWILDGDLGPYDAPAIRLRRPDTVVILDLSLTRCAWRAARVPGKAQASGGVADLALA